MISQIVDGIEDSSIFGAVSNLANAEHGGRAGESWATLGNAVPCMACFMWSALHSLLFPFRWDSQAEMRRKPETSSSLLTVPLGKRRVPLCRSMLDTVCWDLL
jgi:hypothetical protein